MANRDELERYEQSAAREIIHWLETLRPSQTVRAPADFEARVLAQIDARRAGMLPP
jgi:hypothetical protein